MGVELDDEWGHEQAGNKIMNDNAAEAAQGTRELRDAAYWGARTAVDAGWLSSPPNDTPSVPLKRPNHSIYIFELIFWFSTQTKFEHIFWFFWLKTPRPRDP